MEFTVSGASLRSHQHRRRQRRPRLRAACGRVRRQGGRDRIAPLGRHLRERRLRSEEGHVERGERRLESRRRRATTDSTSRVGDNDWPALKRKRDAYVLRLNGIYERNLAAKGVTYVRGAARFVDANTVEVNGARLTARHIVIATGGSADGAGVAGRRARHHLGRLFRARAAAEARRHRRQRLRRLRAGRSVPRARQRRWSCSSARIIC